MAVFGVTVEIALRAVAVAVAAPGAERPDRVRGKGRALRAVAMALGEIAVGPGPAQEHPRGPQGRVDTGAYEAGRGGGLIAETTLLWCRCWI